MEQQRLHFLENFYQNHFFSRGIHQLSSRVKKQRYRSNVVAAYGLRDPLKGFDWSRVNGVWCTYQETPQWNLNGQIVCKQTLTERHKGLNTRTVSETHSGYVRQMVEHVLRKNDNKSKLKIVGLPKLQSNLKQATEIRDCSNRGCVIYKETKGNLPVLTGLAGSCL